MKRKIVDSLAGWVNRYQRSILLQRVSSILAIDVLIKLSGIILLPVYLRVMTQDEYGLYNYILSIVMTFAVVLNFGLYIPLSKYYHDLQDAQKRSLLYTISILLVVFLVLITAPIYLAGLDFYLVKILFKNPIDYNSYRYVILLALVVTVLNFMLTSFFFNSEKIETAKRYNLWRIVSINPVTIALLIIFATADTVRLRLQSTYVIELLLFLFFLRVPIAEMAKKFDLKLAKSSLKLGLPVMISAIFGIIINFSDKYFLEKYTDSFVDLSYYYLAFACAGVIPLIFASLQNAWIPLFLKEKDLRTNVARTKKLMWRVGAGFALLSIGIIIFFKLLLVFGIIESKYNETIYILPILLASQTVSVLVTLYSNYLIYFERTHIATITGLVLSVVTLGLNLLLVPRYKAYGAATTTLIANIIYLALYFLIIRYYKGKFLQSGPAIKE